MGHQLSKLNDTPDAEWITYMQYMFSLKGTCGLKIKNRLLEYIWGMQHEVAVLLTYWIQGSKMSHLTVTHNVL